MFSHSFNVDVGARETKMSKPGMSIAGSGADLGEVKVHVIKHKQRRNTHSAVSYDGGMKGVAKVSSRSSDFVYVNNAYVGSLESVNQGRIIQPPVDVLREQYWVCSKWSVAKKVLAIAAGVITGALIGMVVTMIVTGDKAEEVIGGIFRSSAPD